MTVESTEPLTLPGAAPRRWQGGETGALMLGWALVLLPPCLLAVMIWKWGVNTAFADELEYAGFARDFLEGGDWKSWIFRQHNEHRVVTLKLLILALIPTANWSQLAEMFVSWLLTCTMLIALWGAFRDASATSSRARSLLAFAPLAWLVCSASQYESQLYGLMVCHYFSVAGAVVALCMLSRRSWWSLPLALVSAVVGATSIASGILVFTAGLLVLAGQRRHWTRWVIWTVAGAITGALYFRNYLTPPHAGPIEWNASGLVKLIKLELATAGAPLAAGSVAWAMVLGVCLQVACLLTLLRWWKSPAVDRTVSAVGAALCCLGLLNCVSVAMGRAFLVGPGDPLGSRYITHSSLVWYGLLLMWAPDLDVIRMARLRTAVALLLGLGLAAANLHGLHKARAWHRERVLDQYAIQTHDFQSDAILTRLGDPKIMRPRVTLLQRLGLSAFAEPQHLLIMLDGSAAVPSTPIHDGRAVEATLRCPVDELRDVAVVLLPPLGRGAGDVDLTVESEGRTLVQRSFAADSITAWTWVRAPLDHAAPCAGRELKVRLSSTAPGPDGAQAFLAEPYYAGSLAQGGREMNGRQLALALNAEHLGVLD